MEKNIAEFISTFALSLLVSLVWRRENMTYLVRHAVLLLWDRHNIPIMAQQHLCTSCIEQFMSYLVHHVGHKEVKALRQAFIMHVWLEDTFFLPCDDEEGKTKQLDRLEARWGFTLLGLTPKWTGYEIRWGPHQQIQVNLFVCMGDICW